MKNLFSRIWSGIVKFFLASFYFWIALIVGIIVGILSTPEIGIWTFFGIIVAFILFIFGLQLWWFITKTGDYEK